MARNVNSKSIFAGKEPWTKLSFSHDHLCKSRLWTAQQLSLNFFSRHNVLQISEPDYLCLRLNKEFSSVFHLMRCQSRSLWCYNYYGNKKIPKKMPHGQNIISSCRNSQCHKFNVLDSIHHFFSSFFPEIYLDINSNL